MDNIEKYGYQYWAALHKHRRLGLITPYFSILERPDYIKPLLEKGTISEELVERIKKFRPTFNALYGTKF